MGVIVRQAFKDVRLLRWILAAWVLVLVALHGVIIYALGASAVDSQTLHRMSAVETIFAVLGTAAFVVIAGMLVQNDSPSSTTAFWLTRPMSARAMLVSKLLVAFVVLVAFPILLDAIDFVVAGVDVQWLPLSVPFQLAWLLPLMAVAAITGGLPQLVLVTIFEVVLFAGALAGAAALNKIPVSFRFVDILVVCWVLAVLGALLLVYVYATRRLRSSAVVFGIAPALLVAFVVLWPWEQVRGPVYPESKRRSISVTLNRESLQSITRLTTHVIHAPLTISGVPAGTTLYVAAPRGWLQVGAGRVDLEDLGPWAVSPPHPLGEPFVPSSSKDTRAGTEGMQHEASRVMSRALAGTRLLNPDRVPLSHPAISIYMSEGHFDRNANNTGVLHLEFDLVVYEYQVAATAPVEPDVSFSAPGLHATVLDVRAGGDRATIAVREAASRWSGASLINTYLLRNRRLGQSVIGSQRIDASFGGYNTRQFLPVPQSLQLEWRTFNFDWRTPGSRPPADWLKNAELVVVGLERVGKIPVTIEIPGVTLSQIPPT